jgi:ubiquinone/menaquinone biosynthesis C-methylase UbiE
LGPQKADNEGPVHGAFLFSTGLLYFCGMKDNFSTQADLYAKYRPAYPEKLVEFIIANTAHRNTAWDCATGNGQTAKMLSPYFTRVLATDISQRQLDHAWKADNIIYTVQPAEQTDFPDHSIDLVTVSQALHWFDVDKFYAEVKRVGRAGASVAIWMYSLLRISPAIDHIIEEYHFKTLGEYWDRERKYVDDNYSTIPFPFEKIYTPSFAIEYYWTIDEIEGYFNTWSALRNFITANNYNPVPELVKKIKPYWDQRQLQVIFPIHLRMGTL